MNQSITIEKQEKPLKRAIYWLFDVYGITIAIYKSDKIQNYNQAHGEAMRRLRRFSE